jgi:hypothetical protein
MNERIKELLEQCTDQHMTKPWPLIDAEKFAELLIKECMTICEDVAERNDPAIACYYEIKRTFRS